ncbi:TolC family protein [Roseimaritima ulvae]|uniref:Cobalt-zinc-cadmium resistance protein CzcC n=1 Tax=Roseimaritima ulvae TaxID=980254 RepID=A0A5B9QV88_9BACT|nr:TolC family protein [Roseimaritima ulvae]QEG41285.1 Cobalt-zinc-cadmium resistance protein CzcC precursor [Roseimaritima ulvae]
MFGLYQADGKHRLVYLFMEENAVPASQPTSNRSRQSRRWRLRAVLNIILITGSVTSFTTGCQSVGSHVANTTLSSGPVHLAPVYESPSSFQSVVSAPVVTVAFDDQLDADAGDKHPSEDAAKSKREYDGASSLADIMTLNSPGQAIAYVAQPFSTSDDYYFSEQSAGLTLEAIESIALANNPTVAELFATTQKAAGFKTQVGLRANPSIGYQATQLADQGTDQHTVFISQTIITADKLALNRSVLNEAIRAQLMQLEAQKYRIGTDIRVAFYDALAAQQRVNLIQEFQSVADTGVDLAEQLKEAQEGSQLEVVQAKVQQNEIRLALRQAQVQFDAAWRELAALAGNPNMTAEPLQGTLPSEEAELDWPSVASTMIASSPEVQAAQARINQARANICRQEVQPIPNLDVQFAAGVDNGTDNGLINLQIGAPIPVFNKNQGNICAARAEYARASRELDRIQNSIKARLAAVSRDYDSSLVAVEQYTSDILPNAKEGLRLAELAYKAGETSFVQVLIARRTYFDTNLQYIVSQQQLAQARARVDGFVLTGALDAVVDNSGDDSLRGLTLSQQ